MFSSAKSICSPKKIAAKIWLTSIPSGKKDKVKLHGPNIAHITINDTNINSISTGPSSSVGPEQKLS